LKSKKNSFYVKRLRKEPKWLRALLQDPNVALVLLNKPISFKRAKVSNNGSVALSSAPAAPFLTVLAFFGFHNAKLVAPVHQVSPHQFEFTSDKHWIRELKAKTNRFYPIFQRSEFNNANHDKHLEIHKFLDTKMVDSNFDSIPKEHTKGFYNPDKAKAWNWDIYKTKYDSNGKPDFKFHHPKGYLTEPPLHKDLWCLQEYRLQWTKTPVYKKRKHLPNLDAKNKEYATVKKRLDKLIQIQKDLDAKLCCSFCAQSGHSHHFCDWKAKYRHDWSPAQKKLFHFFSIRKPFEIPDIPVNPSLMFYKQLLTKLKAHAEDFWVHFKNWTRGKFCRADIPLYEKTFGNVQNSIAFWHTIGASKLFLAGFISGFTFPKIRHHNVFQEPQRYHMFNNFFPKDELDELNKYLQDGNRQHWMLPIPEPFVYSCENIFFKHSSNKIRFLQDVRLLNLFSSAPHFRLYDAEDVLFRLNPNSFLISWDIKDCFRILTLHPEDRIKACFHVKENGHDQYYCSNAFFGHRWLPFLATKMIGQLSNFLCKLNLLSFNYIDDGATVVAIKPGKINYRQLLGDSEFAKLLGIQQSDLSYLDSNSIKKCLKKFPNSFSTPNRILNELRKKELENYKGPTIPHQKAFMHYCKGVRNFVYDLFQLSGMYLNKKANVEPTRLYKQLGFVLDVSEKKLYPKIERVTGLHALFDEIFSQNKISLEQAQSLNGTINSFKIYNTPFNHVKSCLSLFIAQISRSKPINAKDLYPIDKKHKHRLPAFLAQAFINFIQESEDYGFTLLPDSPDIITLGHVFAPKNWASTKVSKKTFNVVSDASDYAIGAFYEYQGQTSPCTCLPLPLDLQDGFQGYRDLSTSSTTRELYGIYRSLEHFSSQIHASQAKGLRIHCDSQIAIWNIFKLKCSSRSAQRWAFKIRNLLDKINLPTQLFWRRRTEKWLVAADLASKDLYYRANCISPQYKSLLQTQFGINDAFLLNEIPETFFKFADFRVLKHFLTSQSGTPILVAPLSGSRAHAVADEILRCKTDCILIVPAIFRSQYYIHLKTKFQHFEKSYLEIFPDVSYCGFKALTVHITFQ